MAENWRGRVMVLTGASRGIGERIARDLGKDGAHLVLAARDPAALETVATAVRAAGGTATVVVTDVALAADRARLVATAEALGPIDALINNAGIEHAVAVVDQSEADVDSQVAVNLLAPIHLIRAVLPGMIARGRGRIVTVSSMSGKSPTPYNAVYAATKYGLNGLTASLRIELEGTGVTAGVVCPSFVADAGMWSDTGVKAPALIKEVSPAAVVAAVRAVLDGAGEVLVSTPLVRPLLALAQILPGVETPVLRAMGVLDVLRARAVAITAKRTRDRTVTP